MKVWQVIDTGDDILFICGLSHVSIKSTVPIHWTQPRLCELPVGIEKNVVEALVDVLELDAIVGAIVAAVDRGL